MSEAKLPVADVTEILAALSKSPRTVAKATTLEVERRGRKVTVRLTRALLLRALTTFKMLRPDDRDLADELIDFVTLHRRRGPRFGKTTATVLWRQSSASLRPVLQIPLSLYSIDLDISPPEKGQRSDHTLEVEFFKDRVIIYTGRLATDGGDWLSESDTSED